MEFIIENVKVFQTKLRNRYVIQKAEIKLDLNTQ